MPSQKTLDRFEEERDQKRHTFTIPPGHEAVRDSEGRATGETKAVTPPNPKKLYGDKKPPLHLLPLAGMIHQALAHMDGNNKYGFENWNESPIESLTYLGAIQRHVGLYKYGERYTRDTKVHNLGAVMACCAILIDAELNGNLIDNTKHSKAACDLLHEAEGIVEVLNAAQRERDEAKRNG